MFGFGNAEPAEHTEPTVEEAAAAEAAKAAAAAATKPLEGLDKFASIFDNDKSQKEGKPASPTEPPAPFDPMALLEDEEAITGLLSKVDFSTSISEETQKKLTDQAPDALISLTNDIGKAAYLQAMRHSTALNAKYLKEQISLHGKTVSSQISNSISDADLAKVLPEINNPIIAAGIEPFISKYRNQNPNATAEDVAKITRDYLKELNMSVNPDKTPPSPDTQDSIDWEKELGVTF